MPISTEAIGLVGVSKSYPGVKALSDISFNVARGKIHGFLGPNGAGKSTTMNIITGLLSESAGVVRIMGEELSANKRKEMIGYLPEIPPVYPQMRVRDYLEFVAAINNQKNKNKISEAVLACGLEQVEKRMIGNLSKGFRQRVGLAQALVKGAEVLILDEPTVGLDPVSVSEIRTLIKNLKGDHTVLLSSHLLHEISLVCDDITMINHGKLVASGSMQEIEARFASGARFRVRANKLGDDVIKALATSFDTTVESGSDSWLLQSKTADKAQNILELLVSSGAGVREFYQEKTELEDVFKTAMNSGEIQ